MSLLIASIHDKNNAECQIVCDKKPRPHACRYLRRASMFPWHKTLNTALCLRPHAPLDYHTSEGGLIICSDTHVSKSDLLSSQDHRRMLLNVQEEGNSIESSSCAACMVQHLPFSTSSTNMNNLTQ